MKWTKEYRAEYARKWGRKHPEKIVLRNRKQRLKRFGLTIQSYEAMVIEQKGLCAICCKPEPRPNTRLSIDHSHVTNRIRKLLCSKCNPAIGLFSENPEILSRAIDYISEPGMSFWFDVEELP